MRGFRAGLRCRSPLVLVVAALLTVPALVGVYHLVASGAWTAVPLKYWISSRSDSSSYVSWHTADLKRRPPEAPLVAVVGGSSARESIWSGDGLAADISKAGGPCVVAHSLASLMQTMGGSLVVVENLPSTPTTVVLGVNLARLYAPPAKNLEQVSGRKLPLPGARLRRVAIDQYGQYRYSVPLLPGAFQMAATRISRLYEAALRGRSLLTPYDPHSMDKLPELTPERICRYRRWANGDKSLRALQTNLGASVALIDEMMRIGRERGLKIVLLELPHNPLIVRQGFARTRAYYQAPLRELAGRYGSVYLDFSDEAGLEPADFIDFSHLRPSGRTKWQAKLARELARLYASGVLEDEISAPPGRLCAPSAL